MRIHLSIRTAENIIPFDHQHLLTGTIHKWLGENQEHGKTSLFSFSQLIGAKVTPKGFKFDRSTSFFISAHDTGIIKDLIRGIKQEPVMFNSFKVDEVIIQEDPDLADKELFFLASPVFIKRKIDDRVEHIIYNNPRAGDYLTETMKTKMEIAGLVDQRLKIGFDSSYTRATTKMITYNGIKNRANCCPVIIKGDPETKVFAWNVGLGNSTGIGFGAITY